MASLLEKAQSVPGVRRAHKASTYEECELAVAYLRRDVTDPQVVKVAGVTPGNAPSWSASVIRRGIDAGFVTLRLNKPKGPK